MISWPSLCTQYFENALNSNTVAFFGYSFLSNVSGDGLKLTEYVWIRNGIKPAFKLRCRATAILAKVLESIYFDKLSCNSKMFDYTDLKNQTSNSLKIKKLGYKEVRAFTCSTLYRTVILRKEELKQRIVQPRMICCKQGTSRHNSAILLETLNITGLSVQQTVRCLPTCNFDYASIEW